MEFVSKAYEAQLKDLAHTLVTPERFAPQPKEEIVLIHMTPEQFLGSVATPRMEGCPPDEAYPRCDGCKGCEGF